MQPRASLFKRSFAILAARPAAFATVAILPYVVAIGLPVLIARMIHVPAGHESWDPISLWKSMGWNQKLLIMLAFIASATVPLYLAARGVSRMALEEQKGVHSGLGKVLRDVLWFIPTAIFYCVVIGIPSFIGSCFLMLPGLLIASACALTIPAGIDGHLGPVAALRRGWSLVRNVFGRVLGVYACFAVCVFFSQFIVAAVAGAVAQSDSPARMLSVFGVWFLILLLALALVDIMVTLLYLDAREMSAPSPLVSRAAANHVTPG